MLPHLVATVVLDISYLIVGIILCFIGKDLLEKGITGKFSAGGDISSHKFRLLTSSPGLVFLVAGLVIVVFTIISTTDYKESIAETNDLVSLDPERESQYPGDLPPGVQDTTKHESQKKLVEGAAIRSAPSLKRKDSVNQVLSESSKSMMKRITAYKLEGVQGYQTMANAYFDEAQSTLALNNPARALDNLTIATSLDPQLLDKAIKHPQLKELVTNHYFEYMMRARLSIYYAAQGEAPLAEDAMVVMSMLNIHRLSEQAVKNEHEVKSLLGRIPTKRTTQSKQATYEQLEKLFELSPKAVYELLLQGKYRWILEDADIMKAMRGKVNFNPKN